MIGECPLYKEQYKERSSVVPRTRDQLHPSDLYEYLSDFALENEKVLA